VVGGNMADLLNIKGIGAKGKTYLNKLGIMDTNDLLTYYPVRYDLLSRSDLSKASEEDRVIIDGKVESIPLILRFNKGLNKMNFRLVTQNGVVGVSIFNRAFMKKNLEMGTSIIAIGKYDSKKNVLTASDIRLGALGKEEKIEPVYHLTTGITSKSIHTFINLG
jgi:ATP-dependent DNA helicase RecG